jgi:hypothetical protein
MTKHDFIAQHKMARHAQKRRLIYVSAFVWGFGLAAVFGVIRHLRTWEDQGNFDWLGSVHKEWVIGAGGFIVILLALAMHFVSEPYGVECPCCRKKLLHVSVLLALMTGNCGYCGEKVVDDCDGNTGDVGPILPA